MHKKKVTNTRHTQKPHYESGKPNTTALPISLSLKVAGAKNNVKGKKKAIKVYPEERNKFHLLKKENKSSIYVNFRRIHISSREFSCVISISESFKKIQRKYRRK
jgi:hypothetical protein